MKLADRLRLASDALREHRLRSFLSILGIAIGIGAAILLTSLGEGTRLFIALQFSQFGTNIVQVTPGRTETFGVPGVMGGTTHALTLEDAQALERLPGVREVVPVVFGQARVSHAERGRGVYVYGVSQRAPELWGMGVVQGTFLAPGDVRRGAPIAVLGPVLKRELFGDRNAIGAFVRVAGWRLRVVGVMEPKGRILGFDLDDVAWVPVATAMSMFDQEGLNEIDVTFAHASLEEPVVEAVLETLRERHGGDEDVTVLTQSGMLAVLDDILRVVTVGVVAIGAISLLVGAIGILSVLWIAVGERTGEIGLLRAVGASAGDVRGIFLLEAVALSLVGGTLGLAGGLGLARLLTLVVPGLPLHVSPVPAVAALAVSLATGLVSGLAPARRAAQLDPVEALRAE